MSLSVTEQNAMCCSSVCDPGDTQREEEEEKAVLIEGSG
jgi:hypothetical protein